MMSDPMANAAQLVGIQIGIPESRYGEEFAALFERAGARVRRCPLRKETLLEDQSTTRAFIDMSVASRLDMTIFMTGVGVDLIFRQADDAGKQDAFLAAVQRMTIVSRGSKSTAALRKRNVRVDIVPMVATSEGIIDTLRSHDLRGKNVAVQLYGTPNPELCSALESSGAAVFPVSVYTYQAASDSREIESFVRDIIDGEIRVVVFTSAPQVHALFDTAADMNLDNQLRETFVNRIRVASIGEITTRALKAHNVTPHIVPDQPRMGALVKAVCITPLS